MIRTVRTGLAALGLAAALAVAGCVPVSPNLAAGSTVPLPTPTTDADDLIVDATATAVIEAGGAVATVATRSLRVRALPTVNSAQTGSILNGESYPVTARSSDGMWLELEILALGGSGWVTASLVTMAGDITDLPIVEVPTPAPPTATPTPTPAPVILPTATQQAGTAAPVTATVATTDTAAPAEIPTEAPTATPSAPVTETVAAELTPEPTATPTFAPVAPPPAGSVGVSVPARVRVRAEPNTEAAIVGHIYPGEVFQIVEQTADGSWTRIAGSATSRENPSGGWVASEFLLFGQ